MATRQAESEKSFRIESTYADTLTLTLEYDTSKMKELLAALSLTSSLQTQVEVTQTRSFIDISDYNVRCQWDLNTQEPEQGKHTSLISWYREMIASGDVSPALLKKCEHRANEAEPFLRIILPRILDPIVMPPLPASLNYFSSQKNEAITGLIRDIAANLTGNLSSYTKYVTTELVADPKLEETEQNEELSKGILTAGGPDGFGGTFDFSLFYFPALNALTLHTALAIQQVLGGALALIDDKKLEPDEAESYMNNAQEVCQEMANAYVKKARDHFINGIEKKIRSAIAEHIDESIAVSKLALDRKPFGKKPGWQISIDGPSVVDRLIKWREKQTKRRINAPKHGGSRQKPKHFESISKENRFASEVNKLLEPFHRKRTLWEYILDTMEYEEYDPQCLEILKGNPRLAAVPLDLIKEAFKSRKPNYESGQKMPRHLSPQAFTFKHACHNMKIENPPSYEALRKAFYAGRARIKIENPL